MTIRLEPWGYEVPDADADLLECGSLWPNRDDPTRFCVRCGEHNYRGLYSWFCTKDCAKKAVRSRAVSASSEQRAERRREREAAKALTAEAAKAPEDYVEYLRNYPERPPVQRVWSA